MLMNGDDEVYHLFHLIFNLCVHQYIDIQRWIQHQVVYHYQSNDTRLNTLHKRNLKC